MSPPALGESARHQPFTEIDAINTDACDHAVIPVSPSGRMRFDPACARHSPHRIVAGCLSQFAFFRALRPPTAFGRVDVLDPVALLPVPKSVAVDHDRFAEDETDGDQEGEKQSLGYGTTTGSNAT